MAKYGFTVYGVEPAPVLTIPEILALLSADQKGKILEGFAEDGNPMNWRQWMKDNYPDISNRVPRRVIRRLYEEIQNIQEWCRTEMRGERLVTPEQRDEDGNVTQEAVFNTPPTTITALRSLAASAFQEIFTSAQVTAVVNMMVVYSAPGQAGTWTHYRTEVVK